MRHYNKLSTGGSHKSLIFFTIICLTMIIFISPIKAESEPNDDFQSAQEITAGSYSGSVTDSDVYDYYKILLEPSTKVTVIFSGVKTTGFQPDYYIELLDTNNEKKFTLVSSENVEKTDEYYLSNETTEDYWFLKVYGESAGSINGEYTFTINLSAQNDANSKGDVSNSYSDSYKVTAGKKINGFLGDLDEIDMYKIMLYPSSTISIEFSSTATGLAEHELKLLNPNKEEVFKLQSSDETIDSNEYQIANDTPQDYWFIKIYPDSPGSFIGNYTFTIQLDYEEGTSKPQPVTVTLKKTSKNSIEISWDEYTLGNFSSYEIYLSTNSNNLGEKHKTITSSSINSYNITGLTTDKTYYITVRVVDTLGEHADSNTIIASTESGSKVKGNGKGIFGGLNLLWLVLIIIIIVILVVLILVKVHKNEE